MTSRITHAKAAAAAIEDTSDLGYSSAKATNKHMYSDIVASRPPSPTNEENATRVSKGETSTVRPINNDENNSLDDDPSLAKINPIDKQKEKEEANKESVETLPNKGKTVDPQEWGNLKISNKELDTQAQAEALKFMNTIRNYIIRINRRPRKEPLRKQQRK